MADPELADAQGKPLAGVRVLELGLGEMAAVGAVLADLGAEVIRVEPPGGDQDRREAPLLGDVSLAFVAANRGKLSVELDLDDLADRRRFDDLVASADILTARQDRGLSRSELETLAQRQPALVTLAISDFSPGDYESWRLTDPVIHALTGELSLSGLPGRPPSLPPARLAYSCAAAHAVYVTLLAYWNLLQSGRGDLLDLSILEAAQQALDPGFGVTGTASVGLPLSDLPRGRPDKAHQYPIIPCADGFVRLCVLTPRQWQGMFEWLGRPAEFADPIFSATQHRFASPTLVPAIARLFADKTRAELEAAGPRYGVAIAALLTLQEALGNEHLRSRAALGSYEVAPGRFASFPNGPIVVDGERTSAGGPAPRQGAHQHLLAAVSKPRGREVASQESGRPLEGLRVLDFGIVVVGADTGRLLADQGAEVIKIETQAFPDSSRHVKDQGFISVNFAVGQRNKHSLGLNLRDPRGRELLLQLAAKADVVLSNFKPGTLPNLGLSNETLLAANPRLVLVDSSAFGPTGPWSKRLGYGPLVRASLGLSAEWRYPGEEAGFCDATTVYPDHVAARFGAVSALALLIRRQRTGRGGSASIAQAEVYLTHVAREIAALTADGDVAWPAAGAPWGVFPCKGDDEWCVVTVRDQAEWQGLCVALGRPDLASDPALSTVEGRLTQRERVDLALTSWLAHLSPREAMTRLQRGGVPAGAMLRITELPEFPYYRARGFYRAARHDLLADAFTVENAPVTSWRLPDPAAGFAPLRGEHTVLIARTLLGLEPHAIEVLCAEKVLEPTSPSDAALAKRVRGG